MFVPAKKHHQELLDWLVANKAPVEDIKRMRGGRVDREPILSRPYFDDDGRGPFFKTIEPAIVFPRVMTPKRSERWPREWSDAQKRGYWPLVSRP